MYSKRFMERVESLEKEYKRLAIMKNSPLDFDNGVYKRYKNVLLTAQHVPLSWRYDYDEETNPYYMERLGVNGVLNPGAIEIDGKILLMVRIEGVDRKSFFAVAESETGVDNFLFWDYPVLMPEIAEMDTNIYDMRLVKHQDGWIYGAFCTERKDKNTPMGDTSSAVAQCGIARTKDLRTWERLQDIKTKSPQQRNIVLHPEFIDGKYAFYTRPSDGFMDVGMAGGIGWGLSESIENVIIEEEIIFEPKVYHTIKEAKNGQGPAPIKTEKGWLNLAHGVRNNADGMRYVLYMFLTDLHDPSKVIARPGGYFMAPEGEERVGDVSDVLFCNGWVAKSNGDVFIYYASSDTRIHVTTSTVDRLLDYVLNTPEDAGRSHECVNQRIELIKKNINS